MIDQPSQEADQEHDILKRQRMPLMVEAQKLAMWDELVDALTVAHAEIAIGRFYADETARRSTLLGRALEIK